MKTNKSMIIGLSIAALVGCGRDNKKASDVAQTPSEAQNKEMVAQMEQKAPKYIIAIADKDGKIISTQTSDKMPEGTTNEEIALNIIKNQNKGTAITVLTSDATDGKDQSTESSYSWGGGHGGNNWGHGGNNWGHGGNNWGHGGNNWGWNSSYYPVYGYATAGYPTYYGAYAYSCGAPVAYQAATYQVAVYNWASSYAYAPVGGCGYGYGYAAGCAVPFGVPSYY